MFLSIKSWNRITTCLLIVVLISNALYFFHDDLCESRKIKKEKIHGNPDLEYLKDETFLFIGGFPRSGTTLLRVILDSHPLLSCGPETRILPRILRVREEFSSKGERKRLHEAGVDTDLVSRLFLMAMDDIRRYRNDGNKFKSSHTCFKDPFILRYTASIGRLLPKSKFILLVRDGRAVAHSVWKRNIKISGLDSRNISAVLKEWSYVTADMVEQCFSVGKRCLLVHYEKLILQERETLRRVLKFLHLPWNKGTLRHWESIFRSSGPRLSRYEPSFTQVIRPVYNTSLQKWMLLPKSILLQAHKLAPMLNVLGYSGQILNQDYFKLDVINTSKV